MTNENWKSGTIYQIYPRSFKDTNNDGFGDIKGIIEKLDYLENLGVSYLWLTPMYVSPQRDNGYDIADYYNIDSKFGTMADFEELLNKAHEKNIRIMMDLVVNHTSSAHYWFQEALKGKDNPYRNYYIWKTLSMEKSQIIGYLNFLVLPGNTSPTQDNIIYIYMKKQCPI